jgi:SAM-dependent methyltransferase
MNDKENFIQDMLYFHSAGAYYRMQNILASIEFSKPMPDLPEFVCKLLEEEKFNRPDDVSTAIISLLRFDPIIKDVFSKISAGKLLGSLQEIIIDLSNVPLLLKLMVVSPLPDLEFENILKDIRSAILLSITDIKPNPEILKFQIALSLHCFTNEYLYDQTDEEIEALKELETLIEKKLTPSSTDLTIGDQTILACLASYRPLYEYSWLHLLSVPVELETLHRRQILEPEKERQLRSSIPILQEIKDEVSCKVQEQYEQNPYPRWVNSPSPLYYFSHFPFKFKSVSEMITQQNLRIWYHGEEIVNPQILITGCGTGRQSIGTATAFKNCDVLAIDLSLNGLAYAKRKTEELSITNIDYMQADILDLRELNRKFDIIESIGVLHHMDDLMKGWKVLTDCLTTGGLMRIGLYSELGRRDIPKIRDEISRSNVDITSHDDIKSFRNTIISSGEEHHKQILDHNTSFYSMSMLRDLLFHVQEHHVSLPQIEDSLSSLGLMFCGFEDSFTVQQFKESYIDNDLYDLNKWVLFEKEHPEWFAGIYQFWCQKV